MKHSNNANNANTPTAPTEQMQTTRTHVCPPLARPTNSVSGSSARNHALPSRSWLEEKDSSLKCNPASVKPRARIVSILLGEQAVAKHAALTEWRMMRERG